LALGGIKEFIEGSGHKLTLKKIKKKKKKKKLLHPRK
jgi:hypothetical protein